MITCQELFAFLHDYESGELPAAQVAELERHLAVCPPCVTYLASYRETIRLGKQAFAAPDAAVLEPVPEELVKAILSARKKQN